MQEIYMKVKTVETYRAFPQQPCGKSIDVPEFGGEDFDNFYIVDSELMSQRLQIGDTNQEWISFVLGPEFQPTIGLS
jgi:hypothetical protein